MKSIAKIVSLNKSELFAGFHNFLIGVIAVLGFRVKLFSIALFPALSLTNLLQVFVFRCKVKAVPSEKKRLRSQWANGQDTLAVQKRCSKSK